MRRKTKARFKKLSDFKTDKEILEAKLNEDQSTEEKDGNRYIK